MTQVTSNILGHRPHRWKVLAAAYLASFTFGVTLQSVPPVLSLLIEDFGLTHAEAGLTMSLFALPMVFLSIPAGLAADRYGPKRVGLAAFAVAIAGGLLSVSSTTFPLFLAGRALAGMGTLTLALIAPQFISHWFLDKELGLAMGSWNTAFPLGAILSFAVMGPVGESFGWRGPLLLAAGIALISMVAFGSLTESGPWSQEGSAPRRPIRSVLGGIGIPIWLVGIAWLFFNASSLSFTTFAPDYFQSQGYSAGASGLLTSMTLWGTFLVSPLVGLLLDRGLRPEVFIGLGSAALALGIFLIPTNSAPVVLLLLLATVVNSAIVVSIFSLPPTLLPPMVLGLGYGVLATCMNIGQALGPTAAGLVRDLSGAYTASFWAMSVMALLIGASILPLFVSRKAPPPGISRP